MSETPPPAAPPPGVQPSGAANADQMQNSLQAMLSPAIPRFYVNGIALAMTPTDLIVTLLWNGAPTCSLNMPYSIAKGVAEDFVRVVAEYERLTEQTIQTSGHIGTVMQRNQTPTGVL